MLAQLMLWSIASPRFDDSADRGRTDESGVGLAILIKVRRPLTQYAFSARVVFKPFVSREDAWEEYQNWRGG